MEAMLGDIIRSKQEKEKRLKELRICYICKGEMESANFKKHFQTVCPGRSNIINQLDIKAGYRDSEDRHLKNILHGQMMERLRKQFRENDYSDEEGMEEIRRQNRERKLREGLI